MLLGKYLQLTAIVGWTGAYPVLSRKKPTANLVSRKVLTPLLGQVIVYGKQASIDQFKQVYSTTSRPGEVKRRKFTEYNIISYFLFSIHTVGRCSQHWTSIQTIYGSEL